MASKRKVLRKIQLGLLPPNAVSNAILAAAETPTTTIEPVTVIEPTPALTATTTATLATAEVTAEDFRKHHPKLTTKTRTHKTTARKKTTKTKKSS